MSDEQLAAAHRVTWVGPSRPVEGTVYVKPIAFPVGDVAYHGRNLTALGEDGDMGVMAEGHGISALRAINAWQRDLLGPCWHTREFGGDLKAEEIWIVVVTSCHDWVDWGFNYATAETPGAIPVTQVRW